MKIDFKLTEEDYIEIGLLHRKGSKKAKISYISERYAFPILIALVVQSFFKGLGFIPSIIISAAVYVAFVVAYPKYKKSSTLKRLRKVNQKSGGEGLFGNMSIDVSSEGMVNSNKEGSIKTDWKKVTNVKETDKYLLIYVDANCSVLPLRAFKNEDEHNTFMNIIKIHCPAVKSGIDTEK